MTRITRAGLAVVLVTAAFSQSSPTYFELTLPDFGVTIPSGKVAADIPLKPITNLNIQLLGSANDNLTYSEVRVRINGSGAGNLFNKKANSRGKFLEMTPQTIRMLRYPIFDNFENSVEVFGSDARGRSYYQNWILRSGSRDQNPYFIYESKTVESDEKALPPDVVVDGPSLPVSPRALDKPCMVQVKGTASAASGIATLTFNGSPMKPTDAPPPAPAKPAPGRGAAVAKPVVVPDCEAPLVVEAPPAPEAKPAAGPGRATATKTGAPGRSGAAQARDLAVKAKTPAAPTAPPPPPPPPPPPVKSAAGTGDDPIKFSESVLVTPETKFVVLEAVDKKGNLRKVTIPINRPAAGPPPKIAGQTWAVVVGVSHFSSEKMPPPMVPTAVSDAKSVAEMLQARGVPEKNILVLLDEQAKLERVRAALGDFAAKARPEDMLIVFFATQGLHDPAAPEKVYLTTNDSQGLKLGSTAIESEELRLMLGRVRSRHTLFFFDVAHALPAEWSFAGKSVVNAQLLGQLYDDKAGHSVLVSGGTAETSRDENGMGVFSAALGEALSGKADVDRNKILTPKEICNYVAERVRQMTKGQQIPQFKVSNDEANLAMLAVN
jgi:hypothetical protein